MRFCKLGVKRLFMRIENNWFFVGKCYIYILCYVRIKCKCFLKCFIKVKISEVNKC